MTSGNQAEDWIGDRVAIDFSSKVGPEMSEENGMEEYPSTPPFITKKGNATERPHVS